VPEPLDAALKELRGLLLDPDRLVRAVAAGRRRNETPRRARAELRPVALKSGPHLQVVTNDGTRPHIRNVAWGAPAAAAVDELLAEPFHNWHVEHADRTVQVRVTKRGEAQVHRAAGVGGSAVDRTHDRAPAHLLDPGDPLYDVIGGNAGKRRQVDAFLRALAATLDFDDLPSPLRVVDLGCGNAYLTFAAYRYLTSRGIQVELTGVDVRPDHQARNSALAARLGWAGSVRFVTDRIVGSTVDGADVVLSLHACDTATDEALVRALGWRAKWILAAPCCHHDIAAQLRANASAAPHPALIQGTLRQRFADVLTDALRAALLRLHGYRVEVVEFVDSVHTPRNLLLRAVRTDAPPTGAQRAEYAALVRAWGVTPALERLLAAQR
jgi:SAM-dependent methyltransferase